METFGVVRGAPYSSLDRLELEGRRTSPRPSAAAKIPKSDALSVYEATLQKLRLGSRRAFGGSAVKDEAADSVSADPSDRSGERSRPAEVNARDSVAVNSTMDDS